ATVRWRRSDTPHAAWEVDAAEQMVLANGSEASWLRVVDECSGAFLQTRVFPPRAVGRGARTLGARAVPRCLHVLGTAVATASGQRLPVGLQGRLAYRSGAVAARSGHCDVVEPAAAAAGQRRGGAFAGNGQTLGRAVQGNERRAVAGEHGPVGRDPAVEI